MDLLEPDKSLKRVWRASSIRRALNMVMANAYLMDQLDLGPFAGLP